MRSTTLRNIRAKRNGKTYRFPAEIIKDVSLIEVLQQNKIKKEIRDLFITHWKDFGSEFFDYVIDHAKWLLLLRYENRLVGIAVVHKKRSQIKPSTTSKPKEQLLIRSEDITSMQDQVRRNAAG